MKIQSIFIFAVACLVLAVLPACKKMVDKVKPEEVTKKKPQAKPRPRKKKEISVDTKNEAKRRLKEAMAKAQPFDRNYVLHELVQEKYKIDLDTLFPDKNYDFNKLKSYDEVVKIWDDRAAARADELYPREQLDKIKKLSEQQFPYFQIGKVVEIKWKRPDGTLITQRGILREVNERRVVVGDRRFLYEDIKYPLRAAFNEAETMKLRNKYVFRVYIAPRSQEKMKVKKKTEESVFAEFGFVKDGKKWHSLKRVVPKEIEPLVEEREKKYLSVQKGQLKRQVYRDMVKEGLISN